MRAPRIRGLPRFRGTRSRYTPSPRLTMPIYLQNVVDLEALETGLVLLPGSVLMGLLGPVFGRVYDRRGPRALLVPGTALVAAVLLLYSTIGESTPVPLLVAAQTLFSVGMAMSFPPLFSASLGSLPRRLYSHGSAVLSTLQQVAGAAGVAILIATYSSLLQAGQRQGLAVEAAGAAGTRAGFLIAAIIALVPFALSFFVRKPADQEAPPSA